MIFESLSRLWTLSLTLSLSRCSAPAASTGPLVPMRAAAMALLPPLTKAAGGAAASAAALAAAAAATSPAAPALAARSPSPCRASGESAGNRGMYNGSMLTYFSGRETRVLEEGEEGKGGSSSQRSQQVPASPPLVFSAHSFQTSACGSAFRRVRACDCIPVRA